MFETIQNPLVILMDIGGGDLQTKSGSRKTNLLGSALTSPIALRQLVVEPLHCEREAEVPTAWHVYPWLAILCHVLSA